MRQSEVQNAGIQVVMVTGDAEETASCNLQKKPESSRMKKTEVVLTHDELEQLSDEELKKNFRMLRVVSRAKPLDKKRLVWMSVV